MGMPTWDGISFTKSDYHGIEIMYSTPFYLSRTERLVASISHEFNEKMSARPSDMVFRGYEVMLKFAKLLIQHGKDFNSHINNKQFRVFTDFDIQPVLNKQNMTLEYFENRKLYFLKFLDGKLAAVN
jgi:hypothetical protein